MGWYDSFVPWTTADEKKKKEKQREGREIAFQSEYKRKHRNDPKGKGDYMMRQKKAPAGARKGGRGLVRKGSVSKSSLALKK